jgi:hypothetical protein
MLDDLPQCNWPNGRAQFETLNVCLLGIRELFVSRHSATPRLPIPDIVMKVIYGPYFAVPATPRVDNLPITACGVDTVARPNQTADYSGCLDGHLAWTST